VWIIGQFENRPGAVRVAFRRQQETAESKEPRITISLSISDDSATVSGEKLEQLISAISNITQISPYNIKLKGVREG
jgi:hypothetical protein